MERSFSPPRAVFDLDDKDRIVIIQGAESTPLAPVYSNGTRLYMTAALLDGEGRPWVLKHSRSKNIICRLKSNLQNMLDKMVNSRPNEVDEAEVNTIENILDLVQLLAWSQLPWRTKKAFQEVRKKMFPLCAVHSIDFCDLMEAHEHLMGTVWQKR